MQYLTKSFLCAGLAAGIAVSASGNVGVIFTDNFTYANAAEFETNWSRSDGVTFESDHVLIERQDSTAYFIAWNGNTADGGWSYTPTDANPLRLTATLWDPGTGALANNSVGLRELGGITPLFEMGLYQPGSTGQYAIRVLNMGVSPSPNWVYFEPDGGIRTEGWHTFEATFTGSSVEVTLDLNSNGLIDHTLSYASTGIAAFSDLRIGGPGGAAITGLPVGYGSLTLEVIPEPGTYAAIFGGLALLGAIVYRRRLSVRK